MKHLAFGRDKCQGVGFIDKERLLFWAKKTILCKFGTCDTIQAKEILDIFSAGVFGCLFLFSGCNNSFWPRGSVGRFRWVQNGKETKEGYSLANPLME